MRAPAIFVGHGSPMNAIEDNAYSRSWREIGRKSTPQAILCVSAHWYTNRTMAANQAEPKMIYDMYGFPKELYEVVYPAKGSPEIAGRIQEILGDTVSLSDSWGLDHGTWSVLKWMYPEADIPVLQLSINATQKGDYHFALGAKLAALRDEGVMILGSGNVVHNLRKVNWGMLDGYPWAHEFDDYIKNAILNWELEKAIDPKSAGEIQKLAFPTPDHYYPLLYVLGAATKDEPCKIYNDQVMMGSLSMTSYCFGEEFK